MMFLSGISVNMKNHLICRSLNVWWKKAFKEVARRKFSGYWVNLRYTTQDNFQTSYTQTHTKPIFNHRLMKKNSFGCGCLVWMIATNSRAAVTLILLCVMKCILVTFKTTVSVNRPICMIVFWVKVLCNFVSKYQSFRPQRWRHKIYLHYVLTQKNTMWMLSNHKHNNYQWKGAVKQRE
jgi:hypothetical protein